MSNFKKLPIAVFDSGLGGLSVVHEIMTHLSSEDVLYIADNANYPYGEKSETQIETYFTNILKQLEGRVCLLICACFSASSLKNFEIIKTKFSFDIISMYQPNLSHEIQLNYSDEGVAAYIATERTVNSGKMHSFIRESLPNAIIEGRSAGMLVELISSSQLDQHLIEKVFSVIFKAWSEDKLSFLLMGCTHFYHVKSQVKSFYPNLNIIDPAISVVQWVKSNYFQNMKKAKGTESKTSANLSIHTTKSCSNFAEILERYNSKILKKSVWSILEEF